MRGRTNAPQCEHESRAPRSVRGGIVLAGIWLTGGVLSDDFRVSMALTALWFALVTVAALVVWQRAPHLRLAVSAVAVATMVSSAATSR